MQEETNEKTIALYIKTGKLTAQQLQKAMKALLAQMKKQHDKQKIPHGKQTLKQLMKQNAGVSNIEITKDNTSKNDSASKVRGLRAGADDYFPCSDNPICTYIPLGVPSGPDSLDTPVTCHGVS